MTPEAQRIAIAEACGKSPSGHWRCLSCNREVQPNFVTFAETHDGCGHPVEWIESPDYPADLNAMHEAEATFDNCEIKWKTYRDWILTIVEPHRHEIHATAAQRAEAFLRTIGKWQETAPAQK